VGKLTTGIKVHVLDESTSRDRDADTMRRGTVGKLTTGIKVHVLDESTSRDRDADKRRQFWYSGVRTMRYPSGDEYKGAWEGGRYHGMGVFTSAGGYRYEGEFFRGKQHGHCHETSPDGMDYKGEYVGGTRNGNGVLTWPNGDTYQGEFQEGLRHGLGKQTWVIGGGAVYIYDGEWKNNLQNGDGVITELGERHEVVSKHGSIILKRDAVREVVAKHGSILLKRDAVREVQTFEFADGARFEGETAATSEPDVFFQHGKGVKFALAKSYHIGSTLRPHPLAPPDGLWRLHYIKQKAFASEVWPSGDRYEGDFREGKREGTARVVSTDPSTDPGRVRLG
ncbi:hypothetical protein T484DRAFT_1791619, partial [Baffinella frigidus]